MKWTSLRKEEQDKKKTSSDGEKIVWLCFSLLRFPFFRRINLTRGHQKANAKWELKGKLKKKTPFSDPTNGVSTKFLFLPCSWLGLPIRSESHPLQFILNFHQIYFIQFLSFFIVNDAEIWTSFYSNKTNFLLC